MNAHLQTGEAARQELTGRLAQAFDEARKETLQLFDLVSEEAELHQSPGGGFRPIIWHLAHIGVFESYWLLQKLNGRSAPDERYERIFDPIKTPREESKDLPSRREMERYLTRVREDVLGYLKEARFDSSDPLLRDGYIFQLVLEHERQHQETLAYLLHMLDPSKKLHALSHVGAATLPRVETARTVEPEMLTVTGGPCVVGAVWDSFAYDNEYPAHEVFVPPFKIARLPTTNEEYARFIAEGGYERREFWSEEGWAWREREGWTSPLYWRRGADGSWSTQTMFAESALEARHPLAGVSWFEAEAYARFARKRLPSEAEWERAASWDAERQRKRRFAWGNEEPTPDLCNFGSRFWGTTPVGSFPAGASASGCLDMTGNVWEWTADAFEGFEGFQPFPYPEYSETWFDGDHRVLKGGSWATRASVLRTSFRNFFRRHFRIAFAGIRCADDA